MTNYSDYITVDPHICHGQPCFKNTRIMVYLILEMLEAGETPTEIIQNAYPQLTKEHIQTALHYAAEVIKTGEYIPFAAEAR
ncbi:MAG: DUF433 domain-containing protein [Candidatus Omnitrophica bacterium]|nr:DUF433 domain-containing protein [Candidatus Omnitrophota bacterium]MBU0896260.1 DUF433 domain-containing protein [Candidatus Omnitrophota bacterium]MBU1366319.1 DUF433 domain-containing protein [Candidatus Omnitrophota bacterium]MBU1524046.1 DUF433 domain-containing protein [Candidatus Omnitrophota bacterium]MBU1811014.1 DUF433 domain-containing protein [Candidatus Omnitrophota bacterium]